MTREPTEERLTEMRTVKTRALGGLEVSALGLGCMGLSIAVEAVRER
jgi:aryl-alcohol dehydrogenase-like predicted oxidoreductase